jgi:DNA-binding HxlR family transcriptional regulator
MLTQPRTNSQPTLVLDTAPTLEFLMTLAAVSEPTEPLEVGSGWLRSIERQAGDDLIHRVREFAGDSWFVWVELLHVAAGAPEPRDADAAIRHLRTVDAREVCRRLVGYYDPDVRAAIGADLIDRALCGDDASRSELKAMASLPFPGTLIDRDVATTKSLLLELLDAWAANVWPSVERIAMPVLARDLAEKQLMLRQLPLDRFLTSVTRGIRWPAPSPALRSVTLVPSYVARPWVINADSEDVMLVVYPVSDASLGSPSDLATRRLARLSAAYRARHRWAILRELRKGDRTQAELAERLGVAPADLTTDLLRLRSAGLVMIDAETHRYQLHEAAVPDFGQLLNAYLGAVEAGAGAGNDSPATSMHALGVTRRST